MTAQRQCLVSSQSPRHRCRGLGKPSADPSLHSPWIFEQLVEPYQDWAPKTQLQ